jgi:hypothetical protein
MYVPAEPDAGPRSRCVALRFDTRRVPEPRTWPSAIATFSPELWGRLGMVYFDLAEAENLARTGRAS